LNPNRTPHASRPHAQGSLRINPLRSNLTRRTQPQQHLPRGFPPSPTNSVVTDSLPAAPNNRRSSKRKHNAVNFLQEHDDSEITPPTSTLLHIDKRQKGSHTHSHSSSSNIPINLPTTIQQVNPVTRENNTNNNNKKRKESSFASDTTQQAKAPTKQYPSFIHQYFKPRTFSTQNREIITSRIQYATLPISSETTPRSILPQSPTPIPTAQPLRTSSPSLSELLQIIIQPTEGAPAEDAQLAQEEGRLFLQQLSNNVVYALEPTDTVTRVAHLQQIPATIRDSLKRVYGVFFNSTKEPSTPTTPGGTTQDLSLSTPPSTTQASDQDSISSGSEEGSIALTIGTTRTTQRSRRHVRKKQKLLTLEEKQIAFSLQFGEIPRDKPDGVSRVCFGNIGPAGLQPFDMSKIQAIRHFLRQWQVDHFGACETQVNWTHIPYEKRLEELFFSETLLRCICAHNTNDADNHSQRQQGGTMSMSMGEMAGRMHSKGVDSSGLGRWVWQLFRGKDGITTRIYTAYRPCISQGAKKLNTVYTQHKRHFRLIRKPGEKDRCPRDAFLEDLEQELQARKLAGERLILMMDANGDVTSGPIKRFIMALGLQNSILSHYPDLPPPATHQRGSTTIDIILNSPEIKIVHAAFLAGQDSLGDHRMAMVDFSDSTVLGDNLLKAIRPQARRLAVGIPTAKRSYIAYVNKSFAHHKVLPRLYAIQRDRYKDSPLSLVQEETMAAIDRTREEIMKAGEKQCRKLCMGAVDYSPFMVNLGTLRPHPQEQTNQQDRQPLPKSDA
jgi:hypothetical protein